MTASSETWRTDTQALLILVLAGGPLLPLRQLLDQLGDATAVLAAGAATWRAAGCTADQCHALAHPDPAALARGLNWLAEPRHQLLGWATADYPPLLGQAPNPPVALFVDGNPGVLWQPAIAVVGSRNPSAGGRDSARHLADELARCGLTSYAVIGTGPDIAYPRHHRQLQAELAAHGAVVSEYAPGTVPRSGQFPARNRLLAALTLGTVVVEAAERSGALLTARLASEAGREVFAVPGSIHNPMARGCHRLIRDGATLVTQADHILEGVANLAGELGNALQNRLHTPISTAVTGPSPVPDLPDPDYQRLWEALGHDPTGMDSLIERSGLTAAKLSSMLLLMELQGSVSSAHGRYSRT